MRIAWSRRLLVLAITALIFLPITLFVLTRTPLYRAEALLLLPTTTAGRLNEGRPIQGHDTIELRNRGRASQKRCSGALSHREYGARHDR